MSSISDRIAAMKQCGIRYIGGRGTLLFGEACHVGFGEAFAAINEGREPWVRGVVLDRGTEKEHGTGQRYSYPFDYDGGAVYWLRKVTWTNDI